MRIVNNADTVPPAVNRFLLRSEGPVVIIRLHPARLVPPAVIATGALLSAIAVSPLVRGDLPMELAVWLIAGFLIAQLARAVLDWFSRYIVITVRRVFMLDGSGVTVEFPVHTIEGVRLRRSVAGKIFGFGTLVFDSARIAFDYVPYPEQVYREITGLIYKLTDEED